jgi:hypothetical protein
LPLDTAAQRFQPFDQQPLVLVLRKDVQEGVRRQVGADGVERHARGGFSLHPKIDGGNMVSLGDHCVCEIELPVEFERSGLHRQSARGRSRLGGLVNNAHLDAELCQPKRQYQTGRACADDQNLTLGHLVLHLGHRTGVALHRMPECRWVASRSGR